MKLNREKQCVEYEQDGLDESTKQFLGKTTTKWHCCLYRGFSCPNCTNPYITHETTDSLLQWDPSKRLTINEVLASSWLNHERSNENINIDKVKEELATIVQCNKGESVTLDLSISQFVDTVCKEFADKLIPDNLCHQLKLRVKSKNDGGAMDEEDDIVDVQTMYEI